VSLLNVVWPERANPDPGLFGRLGRLVHWAGTLAALGNIAIFMSAAANYRAMNGQPMPSWAEMAFGLAAVIYFPARGLRYLFAGE